MHAWTYSTHLVSMGCEENEQLKSFSLFKATDWALFLILPFSILTGVHGNLKAQSRVEVESNVVILRWPSQEVYYNPKRSCGIKISKWKSIFNINKYQYLFQKLYISLSRYNFNSYFILNSPKICLCLKYPSLFFSILHIWIFFHTQ